MAGTFTENDVRLLDKTINIRERIIDSILTKDLPTKERDLLAFTNLLESVDRSIFSKAKINIDDVNSKTAEANKEVLKELLLNLHSGNIGAGSNENTLNKSSPVFEPKGITLVEGETLIGEDIAILPK